MKNTQSELLTQFYKDWLAWLDEGANPKHKTFKRITGLCGALNSWCRKKNLTMTEYIWISQKMTQQFKDAGLNPYCPFDNGQGAYFDSAQYGTCHKNPKRIQWVRDHVNQENKDQA